ncbi:MAG: hypothetical protein ACH36H_08660 [Candidatus Nanopelagicales bacterium]
MLAEGTDGSFRSNLEQHFDRELVPFAVAFTGTAISALSGAAATSATLAWLGGGSLAAGGMGMAGGTVVLASVVAIPVVLAGGAFVSDEGRKELAKQRGLARDLDSAQAQRLMDDGGAADRLGAIIATWGGTAPAHLAGRLLEWQQETTFNISAAGLGSDIRARLTELANEHTAASPHNPADLRIFAPDGSVLSEAQAKAVASTAQRIMGLSVDKYAGMQLIVPSDHLAPSQALLDARLDAANPGFLKHDQYVDVSHRLSDRIQYGDVSSTPIDSAHLRAAAEDPQFGQLLHGTENQREALRDARLAEESAQQREAITAQIGGVVGAAVAGGAVAAGIAATVATMRSIAAIRSGAMTPTAAAVSVAADAGRAFCQTALVTGSGQALRALARSGIGPDAFATGTLPFALARASLSLGQISWGCANGSVSGQDAAAQSAESLARVSFAWAGALIGQVAIPVPVVGAMVGGVVGSLAATLAVQGITTIGALAGTRNSSNRPSPRCRSRLPRHSS